MSFGARLGLGELSFRVDGYSFWGQSYPVEGWLGLSLSDDLVVFGEVYDAHVFDPSSDYGEIAGLNLLGTGLGMKYYLTPGSIYLSASLLFSRVSFDNGVVAPTSSEIVDEHTRWGWTGRLALGKDWQLSRVWRLGLEGDVVLGWMDLAWARGGDDKGSTVRGFSLLGSASYGYEVPRTSSNGRTARRSSVVEIRGGAGYLWTRFDADSIAVASYPLGLSVGWSAGRAAFLADLGYARQPSLSSTSHRDIQSGSSYAVGPRMKYYLTTSGLFVSAALLVSRLEYQGEPSSEAVGTHWGLSGDLSLGKEWRVSESWALGVAAAALLGRMDTEHYGSYFTKGLSALAVANFSYPRSTGDVADVSTEPTVDRVAGLPIPRDAAYPGRHTHDGLYVGARLGFGWLEVGGTEYSPLSGWGTPFALSIGYALARSLVIFGEFHQLQLRHPTASGDLTDLELVSLGPGLTYYVPGINAFASLSTSLSQLGYRNGTPTDTRYGTNATSNWGITGRLSLGKEWWVSSNWGLGLAAEVLLGRMGRPDEPSYGEEGLGRHYTAKGFSLLATASFN